MMLLVRIPCHLALVLKYQRSMLLLLQCWSMEVHVLFINVHMVHWFFDCKSSVYILLGNPPLKYMEFCLLKFKHEHF